MSRLDMDTGSPDLWITSIRCTHEKCQNHRRFDPGLSSTVTELGAPWRIMYGDQSTVSGHLAIDRIEFSDVVIEHQLIGLAERKSVTFLDDVVDGVFGLGFPSLSTFIFDKDQLKDLDDNGGRRRQGRLSTTVLASIMNRDILPAPVFGVWLGDGNSEDASGSPVHGKQLEMKSRLSSKEDRSNNSNIDIHAMSNEQVDGEFLFGSIDASRFEGNLTFVPIVHPNYWQVKVDGITIDGGDQDLHLQGEAVIDTGSTLIILPIAQAKAVNRAIGAQVDEWEGWILRCDSNQKGTLDFYMGGERFSVRRSDLVREPVDTRPGFCYSAVTATPSNVMILGDVFIRNNYCVFDLEHLTIGFAPLRRVLASNRDEFMRRPTSRPNFWDLASILQSPSTTNGSVAEDMPLDLSSVGILSSLDLQPALKAEDYDIEIECIPSAASPCSTPPESNGNSSSHHHHQSKTLRVQAKDIPGTWLGMTTHGDVVTLTNYREELTYRPPPGFIPLSRGKVPSEYLASMAVSHAAELAAPPATSIELGSSTETTFSTDDAAFPVTANSTTEPSPSLTTPPKKKRDLANAWIHKLAKRWQKDFEGFNLLVVHDGGSKQYVGSNREGAEVHILARDSDDNNTSTATKTTVISRDSVAGVSNSVFSRPWRKVNWGAEGMTEVLNRDLKVFGTNPTQLTDAYDEQTELAWMAIQLLTMMRVHTLPFPEDCTTPSQIYEALRERVFIPQVGVMPIWGPGSDAKNGLPPPRYDYGTRSSTIILFGRHTNVAVYVEKVWYGDWDENLGMRPEYASDSAEGLVWWQGEIGRPPAEWRQISGEELEQLIERAKSVVDPTIVLGEE
ncbi:hypothetical protein BGW41_007185 [Actinomortierella wolfii]|nr:hypothetical protein BGW41_007185 [Actinomortierella wolfii]